MGVLLSLIAITSKKLHEHRKKKRADQIASNYIPAANPPTSPQLQQLRSSAPQSSSAAVPGLLSHNPEVNVRSGVPSQLAVATASREDNREGDKGKDKMASDEDYMAFLNKANEDLSASKASPKRSGGLAQLKAIDAGAQLPEEIRTKTESAEWIYVSDADEAFVGVSLKLQTAKLPDEGTLAKLINHADESGEGIEIMDVAEWDPSGQYKEVVKATRDACKGSDVRVYRVPRGGSRVEYWLVGVDKSSSRLVGVKALSIES